MDEHMVIASEGSKSLHRDNLHMLNVIMLCLIPVFLTLQRQNGKRGCASVLQAVQYANDASSI